MESVEWGNALSGEDFLLCTIEEERSSLISGGNTRDPCLENGREAEGPGSDPDGKFLDKPAAGLSHPDMVPDSNGKASTRSLGYWPDLSRNLVESDAVSKTGKQGGPDILLKLIMKRQATGLPDVQLQDMLRGKLRILENDFGEVIALLSELSARMLSIHSDQDLIVITFKTFEEIWKFSTYYSLGFVDHCMENLLLDQSFWLNCPDEEDASIEVQISEASLKIMCKGLLLQEGVFFVRYPLNLQKCEENDQEPKQNDLLVVVDNANSDSKWSGQSLVSGKKVLVPKSHSELLIPFHQWFFKGYSEGIGALSDVTAEFSHPLGQGSCLTVVDYEGVGPEEMSFQMGDRIEIIGFLSTCLQWFLGKNEASGKTGFVKINHVKPDDFTPLANDLLFIDEAEKYFFAEQDKFNEEDSLKSLKKMTRTDISVVYRMDKLGPLNSQEDEKGEQQAPSAQEIELLKAKLNKAVNGLKEKNSISIGNGRETVEEDSVTCDQEDGLFSEEPQEPRFYVGRTGDLDNPEIVHPLLVILDNEEYSEDFKNLYDSCFSFLKSTFYGFSEEEEVVHYLEVAREAAKKRQMQWAQTRICFLLGRMCAKKLKYSQARVYFEEALCVMKGQFTDLFLLIALYTNLVAIYLKQKNKEKCSAIFEKIAALLLGIPNYICTTDMEAEVLKYVLGKAVLSGNMYAEARACFLLAKLHINLKRYEDALPFIERLQFLRNTIMLERRISLDFHFTLGSLYYQKCLPNLAISCVKLSCLQPNRTLMDCLKSANFVMKGASKLCRVTPIIPTQVVPYLKWALPLANSLERDSISRALYLSLSEIYKLHGIYGKAIHDMKMAIKTEVSTSTEEMVDALISLAWLYILNSQPSKAIAFLNTILELPSVEGCPVQQGVVYNMVAISMRRMGNVKEAAENYHRALSISVDSGLKFNQAIINANFGLLCLWSKAYSLSEQFLLKSIHLFSELQDVACDENFIQVLIMLGQYYIEQELKENGIFYYEWALLIALKANLIESQVQATQLLCQFYSSVLPNEAQCIIYNEFLLYLTRKLADKELEGHVLQKTSQLYLTLGTERAFRSALEYTKRSLGIFIDLRKKEMEAYAWLQAGKIYYILGENELVDLYIQVAQDAAVSTEKLEFAMEVFEAAGDVFFNGSQEREKAISFFRDRALPLAIKVENTKVELRLYNKLTELLLHVKTYAEALQYAQTALTLSVTLGDILNERVAYHRLAIVHQSLGQCELAEHFYLKALSLCSSPLEFDEETFYYVRVYVQLGDMTFYDLKDPYDAVGYYHLALAAAMDLGSKKSQLKICTRLATIYHNFLVDREMSLYFYQKARKFATELNIRRLNLSPAQYYKTVAQAPSKSLF
ncbi:SH3 domain and tetratricopeptide repeat-containing protein 1 isoform X2 [Heterodontus francisci]|uniref:SH3 domain and tetratricopeptide repeat-containing protein 1 isoform X2 n=1 Tax=Heterodontus francisci TaxID=7792 RepID=UPI00355C6E0A